MSEVESLKGQLTTYEENLEKEVFSAEEDKKNMALLRSCLYVQITTS